MTVHGPIANAFRTALVAFVAWSTVRGQQPDTGAAGPDLVNMPVVGEMLKHPLLTVVSADPNGQVQFRLAELYHKMFQTGLSSFFSEGTALLFDFPAGSDRLENLRLFRTAVTEITEIDVEHAVVTQTITPAVAAQLKKGDGVFFLRPRVPTRVLRELPDQIPLPAKPPVPPEEAREAEACARSINNLKQIGLALHNFNDAMGVFPPAVTYGPDGKPWHSWRVWLLPYLEQAGLYTQYRFDEPWDGPDNIKLLEFMPDVYRDPIHGDLKGHLTHYAVPVGDRTAFPPQGARQPERVPTGDFLHGPKAGTIGIRDIIDGTSNTIFVVPVSPERKIPWTKPEDLTLGLDFPGLGQPGGIAAPYRAIRGPAGHHAAPVLFGDGSVRLVIDTITPQTLAALLTRAGGEPIAADQIPVDPVPPASNPQFFRLRIRRVGGQVRATLEPARMTDFELPPPTRQATSPLDMAPRR